MKQWIVAVLFCTSMAMACYPDFSDHNTNVITHGANGSDALDDTEAFKSTIEYCKSNGYKTMFIPCGTYFISSPLPNLNDSFSMVNIVGENASQTIIDISGIPAGQPVFKTYGGSGACNASEITSFTIKGNNEEYGIEIRGTCGVRIRDCKFSHLKYGIIYSNDIAPGTFTEYSVAQDCDFIVETAIYYNKGAGDASFHGSGIKGCTINNIDGVLSPAIKIGTGDPNELLYVYNAPMDFQIWTREKINIIEANVSPGSKITTHGAITLEIFNTDSKPVIAGTSVPVNHHGNVISWDADFTFGNFQLNQWSATNEAGGINLSRCPFSVTRKLNSETTAITESKTNMLGSLVTVILTADFYDYRYLLHISHNGYGQNGTVSILCNSRNFNQAGLGTPEFSVNSSGELVITNPAYASTPVTALMGVTPMGQNSHYFIGK